MTDNVEIGEFQSITDMITKHSANDHSLLISIHGSLNQLLGRIEGYTKQLNSLEARQTSCEAKNDARMAALEQKINQWTGLGKGALLILSVLTAINTAMQIFGMANK